MTTNYSTYAKKDCQNNTQNYVQPTIHSVQTDDPDINLNEYLDDKFGKINVEFAKQSSEITTMNKSLNELSTNFTKSVGIIDNINNTNVSQNLLIESNQNTIEQHAKLITDLTLKVDSQREQLSDKNTKQDAEINSLKTNVNDYQLAVQKAILDFDRQLTEVKGNIDINHDEIYEFLTHHFLDMIYPIGSVMISNNNPNENPIYIDLHIRWELLPEGYLLNTSEIPYQTGGDKFIESDHLPPHNHYVSISPDGSHDHQLLHSNYWSVPWWWSFANKDQLERKEVADPDNVKDTNKPKFTTTAPNHTHVATCNDNETKHIPFMPLYVTVKAWLRVQ